VPSRALLTFFRLSMCLCSSLLVLIGPLGQPFNRGSYVIPLLLQRYHTYAECWAHGASSGTVVRTMPTRKKAPPKRDLQKGEMLRVRLTSEQKTAFDAAAQRLGIGLSAFARMSMIERARAEGIEVKG